MMLCSCGQVYASYGGRYEGRIVKELIKNDGGSGSYEEKAMPMLDVFETLKQVMFEFERQLVCLKLIEGRWRQRIV